MKKRWNASQNNVLKYLERLRRAASVEAALLLAILKISKLEKFLRIVSKNF